MTRIYFILLPAVGSLLLSGCASWFEDSAPEDQSTMIEALGQKTTASRPRSEPPGGGKRRYATDVARQSIDDTLPPESRPEQAAASAQPAVAPPAQPVAASPAPAAESIKPAVPAQPSASQKTANLPWLGPALTPMTVVTSVEQNEALAAMPEKPTGAVQYPPANGDPVTISGIGIENRDSRVTHRGEQIATIRFGDGSARLSEEARRILDQVVRLHKQRGGMLRIVGHASSRTADGTLEHHEKVNRDISNRRADGVAKELIRRGTPRDRVEAVAVSDREPLYYEFMPSGEAGNRRAEIFLYNE